MSLVTFFFFLLFTKAIKVVFFSVFMPSESFLRLFTMISFFPLPPSTLTISWCQAYVLKLYFLAVCELKLPGRCSMAHNLSPQVCLTFALPVIAPPEALTSKKKIYNELHHCIWCRVQTMWKDHGLIVRKHWKNLGSCIKELKPVWHQHHQYFNKSSNKNIKTFHLSNIKMNLVPEFFLKIIY